MNKRSLMLALSMFSLLQLQNPLFSEQLDDKSYSTLGNKGVVTFHQEKPLRQEMVEAPIAIPIVPEYVIDPPDVVRISVIDEPTLTRDALVRPDGRITYPLINEFFIQGYTPIQAQEHLKEELSKYLKDIKLTVEVVSFNSKFIYVVGEVGSPVAIPFKGHQRVLDVLLGASWININGAKVGSIKVVRSHAYHPKIFTIDLNKLVKLGDSRQNMYLQNDDIVWVPATLLRRFTIGMQTILAPFSPILTAASTATTLYKLKDQFQGKDNRPITTSVGPIISTVQLTGFQATDTTSVSTTNVGEPNPTLPPA